MSVIFFKDYIKRVIIVHKDRDRTQEKALEIKKWLENKKLEVFLFLQEEALLNTSFDSIPPDVDLTLVLGGDGTYLSTVHMLNGKKSPILGVNMGFLGFLANVRMENCFETLSMVLKGKMEKRPRSMLRVKIRRDKVLRKEMMALNDVVIERGNSSQLLHLSVEIEKKIVGHFKSDGVIVSSPTGSTAYNLSAGGPILHPAVQAFVCTPICPHSLTNRPIIFPENRSLFLSLSKRPAKKNKAVLTVDGQFQMDLSHEDLVEVDKSPFYHYVLRAPEHNYFSLLREKLNFSD